MAHHLGTKYLQSVQLVLRDKLHSYDLGAAVDSQCIRFMPLPIRCAMCANRPQHLSCRAQTDCGGGGGGQATAGATGRSAAK